MTVAAILRSKGSKVATTRPEVTVAAAVKRLRMENIGALVVSEDGEHILGIISERDIILALAHSGADLLGRPVSEVMTRDVRTCRPEDSVRDLMAVMTRYRIRHLPVVEQGRLCGIISIGDVVKKRLEEVELERDVMRDSYLATH
jgi:CBS domain-containing protein